MERTKGGEVTVDPDTDQPNLVASPSSLRHTNPRIRNPPEPSEVKTHGLSGHDGAILDLEDDLSGVPLVFGTLMDVFLVSWVRSPFLTPGFLYWSSLGKVGGGR